MSLRPIPDPESPSQWTTAQLPVAVRFVRLPPAADTARASGTAERAGSAPPEFGEVSEQPGAVRGAPADGMQVDADAGKEAALILGSHVILFGEGLRPDQREDIVRALLFVRLAAEAKVKESKSLKDIHVWFREYYSILSNLGFDEESVSTIDTRSQEFEALDVIQEAASTMLASSPDGLALVERALKVLRDLPADDPCVRLFSSDGRSARAARFQVSLVEPAGADAARLRVVSLAAGLESKTRFDELLYARFHRSRVELIAEWHSLVVDIHFLGTVRESLSSRLEPYANQMEEYARPLPLLQVATEVHEDFLR